MTIWISLLGLAIFSSIHLVPLIIKEVKMLPHKKWLSFAGGVSLGYIYMDILPAISKAFLDVHPSLVQIEKLPYLIALISFVFFYVIEHIATTNKDLHKNQIYPNSTFYIHLVSFAILNIFFGYALTTLVEQGIMIFFSYILGIGVHILVTDVTLKDHHEKTYDQFGRWILSVALFFGWIFGVLSEIDRSYIALILAFISGGIILNVIKEELPIENKSQPKYLVSGAIICAMLLLFV